MQPIYRSPDIAKLIEGGYEVDVIAGYLVLRSIPYLTEVGEVRRGILGTALELSGDVTARPTDHTVLFAGELPHDTDRNPLPLSAAGTGVDIGIGSVFNYQFSVKPRKGYRDYHQKMVTYIGRISGPAQRKDPAANPRTFVPTIAGADRSPFKYLDTASSRANITATASKLEIGSVAIVGLGGTGSYILDLVAKTPVAEIRLYDGDEFAQHNAFRSPGAPTIETLQRRTLKSDYFAEVYSSMRNGICAFGGINENNVEHLKDVDFAFICVDDGPARKTIADALIQFGVPFVDAGLNLRLYGDTLRGQLKVVGCVEPFRTEAYRSLQTGALAQEGLYDTAIQVADMNALAAAIAVIRWKKYLGFYADDNPVYSTVYVVSRGAVTGRPDERDIGD